MNFNNTHRRTDSGKLFVGVGRSIIEVQLAGDTIGFNCCLQHNLEVISVVAVEDPAANNHPRVVIHNHHKIGAPRNPVLCNVRHIASIALPEATECGLFKRFSVTYLRTTGRFEIIHLHKALDRTYAGCGIQKPILHKHIVEHRCIKPRIFFAEFIKMLNCGTVKRLAGTLVCSDGANE